MIKNKPIRKVSSQGTPRYRVFVVDDHSVVREGLKRLIEGEEGFVVCGEAEDGGTALQAIKKVKPDLAIVDLGLQGMNGLDLIKGLSQIRPQLKILVMSMHDELVYAERAMRAGAKGYIMKKENSEDIIKAIRKVMEGKVYLSESMSEKLLEGFSAAAAGYNKPFIENLSDRELEVFQLIGEGNKTKDIATRLNLSVKTIESYREQIKGKLNLSNSSDLIRFAIEWVHSPTPLH